VSIVITTNEPPNIKRLFEDRVEIPLDFDMLLYTKRGPIPIERKAVPSDLLSSVQDGRLTREIRAMKKVSERFIILLHGKMSFDKDGNLLGNYGRNWTRQAISNLIRTLEHVDGAFIETARDDNDLIKIVTEIQVYFDKEKHLSTHIRPRIDTDWFVPSSHEQVAYFYQGIPRLSTVRARDLALKFPDPEDLFKASIKDIRSIHGFGQVLTDTVYNFIHNKRS
jgi:ERCC4-type nuclease